MHWHQDNNHQSILYMFQPTMNLYFVINIHNHIKCINQMVRNQFELIEFEKMKKEKNFLQLYW